MQDPVKTINDIGHAAAWTAAMVCCAIIAIGVLVDLSSDLQWPLLHQCLKGLGR
jgi:hypothetical protein